eukprot:COSAG02_NODE_42_length_46522_cov_109.704478_29_plen_115_part_00
MLRLRGRFMAPWASVVRILAPRPTIRRMATAARAISIALTGDRARTRRAFWQARGRRAAGAAGRRRRGRWPAPRPVAHEPKTLASGWGTPWLKAILYSFLTFSLEFFSQTPVSY